MYFCNLNILKPAKSFFNSFATYRVTVLGGTSRTGQATSMLLRAEPAITSLTLHDHSPSVVGQVVKDLQYVPGACALKAVSEQHDLRQALHESDIILITDSIPENMEKKHQDYLSTNIALVRMIFGLISKLRPMPFTGIIAEPITSLVPIAAQILQRMGTYDPKKLFGLTGTDCLRAQCMYSELHMLNPHECSVPVVCGHTSLTAVPLLSQATPHHNMSARAIKVFTERFQKLGKELSEFGYPPDISTPYNALMFVKAIMRAFETKSKPTVNVFVDNNSFGTNFFAGRVVMTPDGAGEMQRYANLSQYECALLQKAIENLRIEIFDSMKHLARAPKEERGDDIGTHVI